MCIQSEYVMKLIMLMVISVIYLPHLPCYALATEDCGQNDRSAEPCKLASGALNFKVHVSGDPILALPVPLVTSKGFLLER